MQQMMQSLLSKDILYPALKDIVDKVFWFCSYSVLCSYRWCFLCGEEYTYIE
jgi:hypothetical protein